MKKFQKEYKKFIDKISLSEEEFFEIKNNVISSNKKVFNFKIKYAVLLIVFFISALGVVNADKIIKHYKIVPNDNKTFEESNNKSFISNGVIEKDYSKDLLKLNSYYTYDEIEKILDLKMLKNKNFKSGLFVLEHLEIEKNMIAKASFSLVDNNKNKTKPTFSIIIKTNYLNDDSSLTIKGGKIFYEEYYIQKLKTEAIIIKNDEKFADMVIIELTHNDILYEIEFGRVNFDDDIEVENLYNFLESFE